MYYIRSIKTICLIFKIYDYDDFNWNYINFLGMGAYMTNNEKLVSNDWLCMIGFLLLIAGALMIGMTMDGTM